VAFERLTARSALAKHEKPGRRDGYGPLAPVAEAGSDGREILALPAGFSYVVFGQIGSIMLDGVPTPLALDGMAAFEGRGRRIRLIRNHEDRNPSGTGSVPADPGAYDQTARGGDHDARLRSAQANPRGRLRQPVGHHGQLRRWLRPRL
jgi:secreted PhoX family phosphatase